MYAHRSSLIAKTFLRPQDMWDAACDYFEWCRTKPIQEEKVFNHKGLVVRTKINKVRVFTKQGLADYCNMTVDQFWAYGKKEGFEVAIVRIEETIYNQKFTNAAANMLNAGFMQRDLGLADKQEVQSGVTVNLVGADAKL